MAFGRQFPGQRDHKYILNNVEIISAEAVDVVKMLCMCLLFWIVNILLLNYTEALSHTGPYMWVNAKYSYPCMFKYYRTNYFLEKWWPENVALFFFFVFTRCAETLENLEINGYVQLLPWSRGNPPERGARVPGFNSRLLQGLFMFAYLCCCCCVFTVLSKNVIYMIFLQFFLQCYFIFLNILQKLRPILRVS